jgi:hypothetical protein
MPKELFGQALTYLRNQFEHLLVYLDDGLMPIDNNETEQLMKQVALGRKNWMFIGSVAAGYRAADLMSLVSSAHRNDLDIFVYVKDVLDRLLAGETNYDALRPDVWKQSHPEAIRVYRVEERQARADAKAVKRARRRIAKRGWSGPDRLDPLRGPHGGGGRSLNAACRGEPITIQGTGLQSRQFTHARDIARGFQLAVESDVRGEAINLVSVESTTIRSLAEMVAARFPTEVRYTEPRPGDVSPAVVDARRAQSLLGWQAEMPFVRGLGELLDEAR